MANSLLIVLAYNEAKNITQTIKELVNNFDKVLVINDKSNDETLNLLNQLSNEYKNIEVITNKKNLGAGRSFQNAVQYIKDYSTENIVKIDGDGQFDKEDILRIKSILENDNAEYVKSNRFWDEGIQGKIPTIRYLGNSIASLLIKFNTGLFSINDPLNGLFGFKKYVIKEIDIPKIFSRYGYPFYINSLVIRKNFLTVEIFNKVHYGKGEVSQLKAIPVFFKLIIFSITSFFKNISLKLKNSTLQISAIMDIVFITFQIVSYLFILKIFDIRFNDYPGSQTNWLILFVIFQFFSYNIIYRSKIIENDFKIKFFNNLN